MILDVQFSESNQTFNPQFGEVQTIHSKDGKNGKSAYEIALENGFEGTETEWLESLHGYSPVRGVDYWTEADKAEIKSYVDEAILGGVW